jgi:hypothetical protein
MVAPVNANPVRDISQVATQTRPALPVLKAVRTKCIDCCAGQVGEVRKCTATKCALWSYRMGSNPFTNRKGNPATLRPGAAHGNDNDPASTDDPG